MSELSRAGESASGVFGYASINYRSRTALKSRTDFAPPTTQPAPSTRTLLQLHQLREAIEAIKPRRITQVTSQTAAQAAEAISTSAISLSGNSVTELQSTEEINTAATSFQQNGPIWNGSTATAPWTGASTANATVAGSYDGSNGQGVITFEVRRAGTHGDDDLKLRVYAPDGSTIQNLDIDKNDPLNQVYTLNNGLTISLGAGDLIKNDTFEVDTTLLSTSYGPSDPAWTGSSANATIGGSYDGSNGTGDLTFQVNRGGVHGEDDLKIRVYDTNDSLVETVTIKKNDPIDKIYNLSNGLTLSLNNGELIKHETFTVAVDATEPNNFTTEPAWEHGTSTATLSGTYDGSNGTGTLSFKALDNGVHGQDDLRVRVYDTDGSTLETINVDKNDPINQAYQLSNGLSVTFSAGAMIKNETFTVDVQSETNFSTAPNPVESTAEPALAGVYDGSLGTDTLTFKVTQEGTHGSDNLSLDVFQSDGTFLETINVAASDPVGQSYSLASGLEFSLGAGSLALHETFTVDVNHVVPTTVNPNLSFDGTGINDGKLEDAFTISDGSFEINGTEIDVFATDSINSVLARINSANIDVTATFDTASDRILFARGTPGSQHEIVLANDTSGFLAATKLSTAIAENGDGDENSVLSSLQAMSAVSSGSLLVNGVSISLDVDTDSLNDVLDRIEQSLNNVSATFDAQSGLVTIASTAGEDLSIASGGTGFFQALNVNEGLYEHVDGTQGTNRRGGYSSTSRRLTIEAISEFSRSFNKLFDDHGRIDADPHLGKIRENLKIAISEAFQSASDDIDMKRLGIGFDFTESRNGVFNFSSSIQQQFATSLRSTSGARDFQDLFFGPTSREAGLLDRLLEITKASEQDLIAAGGNSVFVDLLA